MPTLSQHFFAMAVQNAWANHRLLAHLFQHQLHHRGQVHAMLAGTRVKPPQLDEFFCANEAHLRAAELAEPGYSEAQIWSPVEPTRSPRRC